VKALEAGCDAYVTKPFDPAELLEKIRDFLQ
jgi:DNA-binding response OmpR family regulator